MTGRATRSWQWTARTWHEGSEQRCPSCQLRGHEWLCGGMPPNLPDAKLVVITAIPVANLDEVRPSRDDRKQGDWLVYTLRP